MKSSAVPGLEGTIQVAGNALVEYENDDTRIDDESHVMRYVEAVPGENFSIKIGFLPAFHWAGHDIEVEVTVDGVYESALLFQREEYQQGLRSGHTVEGVIESDANGHGILRRFRFEALQITDDRSQVNLPEAKELAQVTVTFHRARIGPPTREKGTAAQPTQTAAVSEKALKGRSISTRTELNPAEFTAMQFCKVTYPLGKKPFLSFTFKYRSHKDLQIEGIIPRSPSPVPLEQRDIDTLTMEELRQTLRNERERTRIAGRFKHEGTPRIKRERQDQTPEAGGIEGDEEIEFVSESGRKTKRTRTLRQAADSAAAAIDLTDD